METRPRVRLSYGRLEEPGIKHRNPGYKAKCDIHVYLHLIVEYRLSPLTIMGRMCKTTRVENRGETTRGERTRGETSWGRNVLLPFWAGPPIGAQLAPGKKCVCIPDIQAQLHLYHVKCFVLGKKFSYLISSHR